MELIAIIPMRNKVDVEIRADEKKEGDEWLWEMIEEGRIQYADDVLDLLKLALEGKGGDLPQVSHPLLLGIIVRIDCGICC